MTSKFAQDTQPQKGRRRGPTNTRNAILASAKRLFVANGFHATTLRSIATDANVDVALISHFFGSKDDLFLEAIHVPRSTFRPLLDAFKGSADGLGERLIHAYLDIWETPGSGAPLLSAIRATIPHLQSRDLLPQNSQSWIFDEFSEHVAEANGKDAEARAEVVLSVLFGMVLGRYVFPTRALAKFDAAALADMMAPVIQQMLAPAAGFQAPPHPAPAAGPKAAASAGGRRGATKTARPQEREVRRRRSTDES